MTFFGVVGRMIGARPLRSLVTAFAVAIGVSAVMALSVLTYSLRATATSIMQTGKADFTVAQFGSADLLNSTIDERDVDAIRSMHGVASAVGTYVATANLGASQPFFLEIGLNPNEQAAYGVIVVRGRSYRPTAPSEIMLGWRAALHLGVTVGARVHIEELSFTVTGIYNTAFNPDIASISNNGTSDLVIRNGGQFGLEVPEPTSMALAGLGLTALVVAAKRRSQR